MPRLLHLIDTGGPGGAETVLLNLATGLREYGWKSRVVVPRKDWLHQRLGEEDVDRSVLADGDGGKVRLLLSLRRHMREFRPHLVHAHFLGSGVYGTLASTLSGRIPLICTFHGVPDVDPDDSLRWIKGKILSRPGNRVVYVSRHLRRHLEPLLGVPARRGRIVYNGVRFPEPDPDRRVREELGLGRGDRLVGTVGNVRPAKDFATLMRAARMVRDRMPGVGFVVAGQGSGALMEELRGVHTELELGESFRFLGFRDDIPELTASFDVYASSSRNEGLPLASIEAMGMGKPVVLTECGGVPELVEGGKNGLLVPVEDPTALARGILSLLEDPALARRLGDAARRHAREKFSLERMLESYQGLYEELMPAGRETA